MIRPLDIGTLRVETNLVLSPMSGVTDCAFRSLVRHCSGAALGLVVSEFVAAEGITRDNQRTLSMLRIEDRERPVSIQIFGAEPTRMADAARVVEQAGADIVDINCGWSAPKVGRRGGGGQLTRQTQRLGSGGRPGREGASGPV
ncbi:MAG: tRNA-dihydrouridine synthase, partial [Proteobacteria bacterium]|nr:tRNA-dihydrouridine synthase [Pseudomonadota bacterium]